MENSGNSIDQRAIVETDRMGRGIRIGAFAHVYPEATIGDNVRVGEGTIIRPGAIIDPNCFIGPYCMIGEPTARYYKAPDEHRFAKTHIGANSVIRSYTIIYENVSIGEYFQSGHNTTIREDSTIGNHSSVGGASYVDCRVVIGNYARLHSNVLASEETVIEDFVWVYPYVVIACDKYPPMHRVRPVRIREYAQIGVQSTVLPGVEIGKNALVGAGSLVRADVPAERVVVGNPARDLGSVRDLRDDEGNQIYPWRDFLTEFRGYPWQQ